MAEMDLLPMTDLSLDDESHRRSDVFLKVISTRYNIPLKDTKVLRAVLSMSWFQTRQMSLCAVSRIEVEIKVSVLKLLGRLFESTWLNKTR